MTAEVDEMTNEQEPEQKPKRKPPVRSDPEAHRKRVRDANKARYRAITKLVAAHREEFDALYVAECEPLGITPALSRVKYRAERIRKLEQELADLRRKAGEP
jgi:hypothetical protein